MLKDLISSRIIFRDNAESWEDAIKISSLPLLEEKYINQNYVNSMIEDIKEFGSYVVLRDGLAMPHSRPENGSFKTGMSFLCLKQGVLFPDTDIPVRLFFTLSASDSDSHMDAIMHLANIAGDDNHFEKLETCTTIEEFLQIIE